MAQTLVQSDKLKVSCCLPLQFCEKNNMIPPYNRDHILRLSPYDLVVELTGDLEFKRVSPGEQDPIIIIFVTVNFQIDETWNFSKI